MADILNLQAVIGLDSSDFQNGISALKSGISSSMKVVGAAVAAGTAAVGAFAKSAVSTGSEFDSSMSQVAATMGMTMDDIKNNVNGAGDTFEALRDKAKEMGSSTNFSASEAADGLNILAMSGYSAADSMKMVEDVLHLSAAGSMDMASAAGYVAGALKGFGDEADRSGYYADLMAKGATLANTSVSQLGEAMSGGAASAAAYGQDAESMTIALLRLAEQGEAGSAASTALAAAMKNLYTPTDQAAEALKTLGVDAYDQTTGKARDFNVIVNELAASLEGMSDAEANAYKDTIFGIQGLDAFNKMTVTGIEKQQEWATALAGASDGIGEAAKQYGTMTDNLQGDIDMFNSAMDGLKIAVSDTLMGSAREFVQFGGNALQQITKGFEEGGIDGAVDAIGSVLENLIAMLSEKLPSFLEAGTKIVTALVTAISNNAPQILDAIISVLPIIVDSLATVVPELISSLAKVLAQSAPAIIKAIVGLVPVVIQAIVSALPDILNALFDVWATIWTSIAEMLPELLPQVVEAILGLIELIVDHIDDFIEVVITVWTAVTDAIIQALPILIEKLPEILMQVVDALIENLPILLEAIFNIIIALGQAIIEYGPQILQAVWDVLVHIGEKVGEKLGEFWENAKTWFSDLISSIGTWLSELPGKMAYWIGYAIGAAIKFFVELPGKIHEYLVKTIEKIKNWASDMKEKAKNAGSDFKTMLIDGIKELPTKIKDIGKNIVEGLKNGIKEKWEDFKNWWSNLGQGIIDGFKGTFSISSPSKVMKKLGGFVAEGFGIGFDDEWKDVESNFNNSLAGLNLDYDPVTSMSTAGQAQPIIAESHIYLEGDADGVFRLVKKQNRINTKATGVNALAMA